MYLEIVNNMNKKLSEQKKFLFQVIDLNPNYIYAQDENGRYTLVNQSYAQLMGRDIQDMIGKTDDDIQQDTRLVEKKNHENVMSSHPDQLFIREESITAASGEVIWVQTVKIPITMNDTLRATCCINRHYGTKAI